jgi:hypothetical protein
MSAGQTGKQRASRLPLDYYKTPDLIQRWKLRLTLLALVISLAWVGWALVRGDGRAISSRGPVAVVHATWENDCSACHVAFSPMAESSGMARLSGNGHASDVQCGHCHAGPAHSSKEIAAEVRSCAACHRDHRGRDASLVALADSDCTRCHADLVRHVRPDAGPTTLGNVTSFVTDHPDFRPKNAEDPGHLLFNHQVHMTAGLRPNANGKPFFTLGNVLLKERDRYQALQPEGQRKEGDAVQLTCAACHVTNTGAGAPSTGAYMQPIAYEKHCQACHPLTLEAGVEKPLTVPHRLQPQQAHEFLEGALLTRLVGERGTPLLDEEFAPRPKPGDNPVSSSNKTVRKALAERVEKAERLLYLDKHTCGECHVYQGDVAIKAGSAPAFTVVPPAIPAVWFRQARFDHAAHRAVACAECHVVASSTTAKDVLLPGIDKCRECHRPTGTDGGLPRGGARFGCTECHRYHDVEGPPHGKGAVARPLTIPEFLSGDRR